MSISAVNNTDSLYTDYLSMVEQSNGGGTTSDNQVSGTGSQQGGNDQLMQSIMQAFSQMGISLPPPPNGPPPNSGSNSTSDGATSSTGSASSADSTGSTEDPRQALGKFMHDLFSALESESGPPSAAWHWAS